MKKTTTLTTLIAIVAFNFASAQQTTFSFGKSKLVAQLSNNGWDFNNVASIKNFLYIKEGAKEESSFNVMATPYLNLNANDAVTIKYRFADALVAVYSEDMQGKLTRIAELSPTASSQKVIVPQGGQQRIVVKVENTMTTPANLVINSISFNNYTAVAMKTFSSHDMSLKNMQDTPDQLMAPAPVATNAADYISATSAAAVK
jgi:hypothetical protein